MNFEKFSLMKSYTNDFYNENALFKSFENYPLNSGLFSYLNYYNYDRLFQKETNEIKTNINIPSIFFDKNQIFDNYNSINLNRMNFDNVNLIKLPNFPLTYGLSPYNNFEIENIGEKIEIKNEKKKDKLFLIKKTEKLRIIEEKRKKRFNSRQDNDRVKFVRQILNYYLYQKMMVIIKSYSIKLKLKKFPEKLINEISQINNKQYLDLTIEELYINKELYNSKKLLKHYEHNLRIINLLYKNKDNEFKEKLGIERLLKMKYKDLINEYLQSNEYKQKIYELNKNNDKYNVEKFKFFANNYIKNYKD